MLSEDIFNMINEYFDNELTKEDEILLFTILSQNPDAREYFKKMNLLKVGLNNSSVSFPQDLDKKIFDSIEKKSARIIKKDFYYPFVKYFSYAAIILLLLLNLFFFNRVNSFEVKLNDSIRIISEKSQTIELLLNNILPPAEVEAKFSNEIIIKSN